MVVVAAGPASAVRSVTARILAAVAALGVAVICGLLALGLRVVMARVFFNSGQAKIEGPSIPIDLGVPDLDFAVILPAGVKATTVQMFATQHTDLPIEPVLAAYLFSYAEFVLPICLLLGFATRIAALGLLAMTVLLQVYVLPGMWWAAHVYWVGILTVLVVLGPGAFSIDALIRAVYRRA
jgi:putative oxidoreductase